MSAGLSTQLHGTRMNKSSLKSCAVALVPALATVLLIQASGGSGDAVAQTHSGADPMEGVWESAVTARNCTTGEAVGTFRGAQVFHRGGTLTDTNSNPATSRGPGFGTWSRTGSGYTATFRFYRYNADGSLAGTVRVTRVMTLSGGGNTVNSTNTHQVLGLDGAVQQTGCATDVSTRFS